MGGRHTHTHTSLSNVCYYLLHFQTSTFASGSQMCDLQQKLVTIKSEFYLKKKKAKTELLIKIFLGGTMNQKRNSVTRRGTAYQ